MAVIATEVGAHNSVASGTAVNDSWGWSYEQEVRRPHTTKGNRICIKPVITDHGLSGGGITREPRNLDHCEPTMTRAENTMQGTVLVPLVRVDKVRV